MRRVERCDFRFACVARGNILNAAQAWSLSDFWRRWRSISEFLCWLFRLVKFGHRGDGLERCQPLRRDGVARVLCQRGFEIVLGGRGVAKTEERIFLFRVARRERSFVIRFCFWKLA